MISGRTADAQHGFLEHGALAQHFLELLGVMGA